MNSKNIYRRNLAFICWLLLILSLSFSNAQARHHKAHKKHHAVHSSTLRTAAPVHSNATQSTAAPRGNLTQNIDNIIAKHSTSSDIGVYVQSLTTGNKVYEHNGSKLFMPASSLKTFTAVAALTVLPPDYTFKTKLLAPPHSIDAQGNLNGDLYFYFDGDPSLTRKDINSMLSVLKQLGVRNINGNIYLDDSIFDRAEYGPGWTWDERNFCYAALTSAVNIDHNCFPITIRASRTGTPPIVNKFAGYSFINVTNNAITKSASPARCPLTLHGMEDNNYVLSGCMSPQLREWGFPIAVRSMRAYASSIVTLLLNQQQIGLNGQISFAKTPAETPLATIASHDSPPLCSLIKRMLKKSDNLYADAIYKKLDYHTTGNAGSWEGGAKTLATILSEKTGIDFEKIKIVDGCGLSRRNLLTPQALVALLNYAYRNPSLSSTFIGVLPIAGVDGHLQGRMGSIKGRVRAKTGTMKGITSLAGYIYTNHNQVLAFAIMINNFTGSIQRYQYVEDLICEELARNG